MNGNGDDRLYNLLPAVYRVRDAALGEPLRALMSLIQETHNAVEADIAGLYENWFIETCAEWVVPYIGDLLGVRPLYAASPNTFSARAYVANTLDFRRRKGTAAMLEKLALDVTGWPAHAVEYFQLLATTQYLNHLRPGNSSTANLRDVDGLELLGGAFEQAAHTVDVRRITAGVGKYNIQNVGIFLWRLEDYPIGPISTDPEQAPLFQSDAHAVAEPADGRYTFDPLGVTAPLFNQPQPQANNAGLVTEVNVPGPLRRRPLYEELEALRQAKVDGVPAPTPVYFGANPVLQVRLSGAATVVPFEQIMICDLGDISVTDWRRPLASKSYVPTGGKTSHSMPIALAVDPVRGRIAFPAGAVLPSSIEVAYTYGFSGDVGAGPYDRTVWLSDSTTGPAPFLNPGWRAAVTKDTSITGSDVFLTIAESVAAWNQQPAGTNGLIAILDSQTYVEDLTGTGHIVVPEGSQLLIVAADWESLRKTGAAQAANLAPNGLRPHLRGMLSVTGTAPAASPTPGALFIDGLLLEGSLTVEAGNLQTLGLSHSTITPDGGLTVLSAGTAGNDNSALTVNLYRSICGPIAVNAGVTALNTVDCIVTSGPASSATAAAITAASAPIRLQTTTVFGTTSADVIAASDSLFTGPGTATRQQTGCVRYCYMPAGSQTAQRYACQPDLALAAVPASQRGSVLARVTPQFTSTEFGQPAYAHLALRCAVEIAAGADNGAEMGAFNFLQQPQRLANLQTALAEYLRFGLEAGVLQQT
jgi:hypothetical protein